ncbi:unnamed protein product [Toxocara canis]|uniref:40S ribosomal protein S24 n=1 Tax=Toxocara canis TaxID=6265 RepID=A0A183UHY2_TOXCA|nr:unnamed protein product [Toxocara canis]
MAKVMQMDRNATDKKNKRAAFIGIPHATTEDATKPKDEQMLREAITACKSPQLLEFYVKGRITTKRHHTVNPDTTTTQSYI